MDAQIVRDLILDIIARKIEILRERGVFVVNYDELLTRLNRMGYVDEDEIQCAIMKLVAEKQIKCGKYADQKGWLRDFKQMDKQ